MKRVAPVLLALVAALLVAACAGILGLRSTRQRHFEHRTHLLSGVPCTTCHEGVERAGDRDRLHLPDSSRCVSCHTTPHETRDCANCHTHPLARARAQDARTFLRFEHKTHVPRAKGNCVRCHSNVAKGDIFLRPEMATCFSCHEHKDGFRVTKCDGCHVDLHAEASRPKSHVVHDDDFLREHGMYAASSRSLCSTCHTESSCAECHGQSVPSLPRRLAFDRPLSSTIHPAGFLARHSYESRNQPGLCTTCHTVDYCTACHQEKGVASGLRDSRSPHPTGWLGLLGSPNRHGLAARQNPMECASCHSGAGEALCVGCHREGGVGGSIHPPGWTSELDKRSAMPCRMCHTGGL